MSVVKGFGGMRVYQDELYLNPMVPEKWQSYQFKIRFRGAILQVKAGKDGVVVTNLSDQPVVVNVYQQKETLSAHADLSAVLQ
jgi:maltose phosphorylase